MSISTTYSGDKNAYSIYSDVQSNEYTYSKIKVYPMKKLLPFVMLMGFSSPAFADITHRMTSSVNLHTGAAYNTAERIGSTYTVSGSGVTMDVGGGNSADNKVGGLGSLSSGVGQGSISVATQTTAGGAFELGPIVHSR